MQHLWAILCKEAVVDQQRNSLSIFEILEQVTIVIPSLKELDKIELAIPTEFTLVNLWIDKKNETNRDRNLDMLIKLETPDKKLTELVRKNVKVSKGMKRLRTLTRFAGLKFRGPGIYKFIIESKEKNTYNKVGEVSFEVTIKPSK